MYSLLSKRISSHFASPSLLHHRHHLLPLLSPLLHLSSSPQPQKEMPFLTQYLITSLGFSPVQALKVSTRRNLARIKSPDQPEAVMKFLSDAGLSNTQIKAAVSLVPSLLGCNLDKTLKPNVQEWVAKGFSEKLMVQFILHCPKVLAAKRTPSNLLFLRDFLGATNEALFKSIRRNNSLISLDFNKNFIPNVNLLKEYGFSNQDIVNLLENGSRCMNIDLDSFRRTVELIEELGLARGSRMFLYGLKAIGSFNKDKILKKVELYKSTYGWSLEDIHLAFKKHPYILEFSEEKIKSNMDFLIKKVKLEPKIIASQPSLLGLSVKKRLVPRHHVLSILAAKGLNKDWSFSSLCCLTEKKFLEKYVEPYKKDVPELAQAYFAASGENKFV
jgi:mTERF domain-containing protein, mitochondrial